MDHEFKLPIEFTGSESSRRVSDLVEEIRADIDFELDDAVTDIIRDLPEEYFQRVNRDNQVQHLKGLIASRICQLNGELFLPSADGAQIAVLSQKTYRGQLASILSELPGKQTRLVGAIIYTARSHGFILDIFDFETDQRPAVNSSLTDEIVEKVAHQAGSSSTAVSDFLSRVRSTNVKAPNLEKLTRFFRAYQRVGSSCPVVVDQGTDSDDLSDIVVAIHAQDERSTFRRTTESLSGLSLDIEQAELVIVRLDKDADEPVEARSDKVILMNFLVAAGSDVGPFEVDAWVDSLKTLVSE